MRVERAVWLVPWLLLGAGCLVRHPALEYRLDRLNGPGIPSAGRGGAALSAVDVTYGSPGGAVVIPPRVSATGPHRVALSLEGRVPGCSAVFAPASHPELGLTWTASHKLVISTDARLDAYGTGVPVFLLNEMNDLRAQLDHAAELGCLGDTATRQGVRDVIEHTPLSDSIARGLLLGGYARSGYIDLAAPVGLQITAPLDPEDANDAGYEAGYSLQWYRAVAASGNLVRLEPVRTELRNVRAGNHRRANPHPLAALPSPAFYRLFFLARRETDEFENLILAAGDRPALDAATKILVAQPGACQNLRVPGAACMATPHRFGYEAQLEYRLQGQTAFAPLETTVAGALQAANVNPASIEVLRPYGSRLIPVRAMNPADLRNLLILGGEQIQWPY